MNLQQYSGYNNLGYSDKTPVRSRESLAWGLEDLPYQPFESVKEFKPPGCPTQRKILCLAVLRAVCHSQSWLCPRRGPGLFSLSFPLAVQRIKARACKVSHTAVCQLFSPPFCPLCLAGLGALCCWLSLPWLLGQGDNWPGQGHCGSVSPSSWDIVLCSVSSDLARCPSPWAGCSLSAL